MAETTAALAASTVEARTISEAFAQIQTAQSETLALLACASLARAVIAASTVIGTLAKLSAVGDRASGRAPEIVRDLALEVDARERDISLSLAQALSFA